MPEVLSSIIQESSNELRAILSCKGLVEKFGTVIKECIMKCEESAHIILDKYVSRSLNGSEKEIYLPSNLSISEREEIIQSYLEGPNPNLNYVRLVCQAKNQEGQFILSPKTRLKANKLAEKLNRELLDDPRTITSNLRIEVAFIEEENAPIVKENFDGEKLSYIYNKKYIEKYSNYNIIFYCGRIFNWLNENCMLNLINKSCEVNGLEFALMDKSRTAYPNYQSFEQKNHLALCQLTGLCRVLNQQDTGFETILSTFYEDRLRNFFDYPSLPIELPKINDDWLTKCRIIFPELDNIARQYDTFVKEDEIDADYLSLLKPMKMTEAKSLIVNKYCEVNEENDKISGIIHILFGSGALLDYVEPFKDKNYHSFVDFMAHETVNYNNYQEYQRPRLDYLIDCGILKVKEDCTLEFVDYYEILILKSIWEFGACSYWHYDTASMAAADKMMAKGWLKTDDHLLSKEERKYFSYYTDNAEFTNGYAYRNHYAHGNTPPASDVNSHSTAYYVLLRLLTVLMLKIYDDLLIACKAISKIKFTKL